MNRNKTILIVVFLILVLGIAAFFIFQKPKYTIAPDFVALKVSTNQKDICYRESENAQWQPLLVISNIRDSVLDRLFFMHHPKKFDWVIWTPNKDKIIFLVRNINNENDHPQHWAFIYDLRSGAQTEIPGNQDFKLSIDHQFLLTSFLDQDTHEISDYYVINLNDNKIVLSLNIDPEVYTDIDELDNNIASLLQAHGIIISSKDNSDVLYPPKFTFTSNVSGTLRYAVNNIETGEIVLSLAIDPSYVKNNQLDPAIAGLLNSKGIEIQPALFKGS